MKAPKKHADVKMETADGRCTLTCKRCAEQCVFKLPNDCDFVATVIKAFDTVHARCTEK